MYIDQKIGVSIYKYHLHRQ